MSRSQRLITEEFERLEKEVEVWQLAGKMPQQ